MTHRCKHCNTELQDERIDGEAKDAHENRHVFWEVQEYTYELDGRLVHDKGHAAHGKGRCRLVLKYRLERLRKAIIAYIREYNLEHEYDCPEDNTCKCPLVQAIEAALKEGT